MILGWKIKIFTRAGFEPRSGVKNLQKIYVLVLFLM